MVNGVAVTDRPTDTNRLFRKRLDLDNDNPFWRSALAATLYLKSRTAGNIVAYRGDGSLDGEKQNKRGCGGFRGEVMVYSRYRLV